MGTTFLEHLRRFFIGDEVPELYPSQPEKEEAVVIHAPAVLKHMDHAIKPFLDRVGAYPVHRDLKPHSSEPIVRTSARTGILHTTEGGWSGSEDVFRRHFAPHFMLGMLDNKPYIEQYVPVGLKSKAMLSGDDLAIVQVECIGYSEEKSWQFQEPIVDLIASLMMTCEAEYGIPLSRPWPDGVYGRANFADPHRHEGKYGVIAGWYGHGDVPGNHHWDPGNLRWSELFKRAEKLKEQSTGA